MKKIFCQYAECFFAVILRYCHCCYSVILSLTSYSGKMSPMNTREEIYHMTAKEMARLKVAEKLVEGKVLVKDADYRT